VLSSATFTLGDNIEILTLTGTGNINGTGNAGNNTLIGNSGINVLSGGAGDDTYVISTLGDTIIENANEGTDTVLSSATFKLGNNIENLTLTGSAAIHGTGNAGNNSITGNVAGNVLFGDDGNDSLDGGDGNDSLIGGAGDDVFTVGTGDDVINGGAGTDTVFFSGNYSDYEPLTTTTNFWTVTKTNTSTRQTVKLYGIEKAQFGSAIYTLPNLSNVAPTALALAASAESSISATGRTGPPNFSNSELTSITTSKRRFTSVESMSAVVISGQSVTKATGYG
jgi:Ca2+-binding RTX toxin-like protein